ncbi:MAG TPA: ACT domain-containing protein [Pyrinomonadaceae bacterium]|nr:ACT domain-containing protein [Pyrinomonadaceae bacterium]
MQTTPSASYSLTLRVKLSSRTGTLGEVATAIGRAGGDIGAIDIVSAGGDYIVRDITVSAVSSQHGEQIVEAVRDIDGIEVVNVSCSLKSLPALMRFQSALAQKILTK